MKILGGRSFLPNWVVSACREMYLWPIVGACFVLVLAIVYNALFCGGPLANPVGYLIPILTGALCGMLCAIWYRHAKVHLEEANAHGQRLETLSTRYEKILQSSGEGIYEVDRQGTCLFINRSALEMLGYEEQELLGKNMHRLTHCPPNRETSVDISDCPIHKISVASKGARFRDDIKYRKDGSPFIADTFAYPVIDKDTSSVVVMFRDATEERKLQKRIHHISNFDKLTGLQNRDSFKESLKETLESTHIDHRQHALCYIDIDQFKVINDTVGHVAGDLMLQKFSTHLSEHIRKDDILGRLGGDEFGLILHHCTSSDIKNVIKNLQNHAEKFTFLWDDRVYKVGLSLGICPLDQTINDSIQALKMADQACFLAKELGRNRYHIYSSDDSELSTMNAQMNWVSRINRALNEDRFLLRYQPIERLAKRKKNQKRFEILLSMLDESGGQLPPGSFLPAAERYNLMPSIDRWVVKKAFDWLQKNREELDLLDFVSINLSGDSITEDTFLEFIHSELEKHSFSASKICFEITETVAIQQMHKALHFVKQIKKTGCRFALDDFGSGMASFAYLKHLPITYVKIDGSFICDLIRNPLSREIVHSIQKISRVMQISTIAEHAEDQETLELLESIGIDYVQGYIIARPEILPFELPLKQVDLRG